MNDESEIVTSASTKQRNMLPRFRISVISTKFFAIDDEQPLSSIMVARRGCSVPRHFMWSFSGHWWNDAQVA